MMRRALFILMVVFGVLGHSAVVAMASERALPSGVPNTARQVHSLNLGWQYHRGDTGHQASAAQFKDQGWETVNLPHTYQLTSINLDDCTDDKSQETFHRDISWYRRSFRINAKAGQRVFLEFEGAHQLTEVWVNGRRAGVHAISAYTPFHFDITEIVKLNDTNVVAIKLDNRKTDEIPPDGDRWDYVLFGGLYRDVYLVVTDSLHVTFPWEKRQAGVFVTTPSVNRRNATVSVRTTVRNAGSATRKCEVVTRVLDANDTVVLKLRKKAQIDPGRDHTFMQTGGIVEEMHLWSFDDPYLYRVNTQVVDQGRVVDMVENPLGLRWFEMRPGVGFCMNGEPIELVGANRHQQYPYIGDAVPNNLHWSDAYKFKQCGMNIIRLAHYPHDNAFFEACDKLGILVCEEPPTWIEFGPPIWMDRLEESFRRTIRNHRNHPCVWGWGAGINHRGPVQRLQYAAKEEDPTRITMNNGTLWTGPQHAGVTDLYSVMDYRGARRPEDQFLFAMEHGGSTDTRGNQRIVSRYKGDPDLIGLTLWSAHDNYSFIKRGKPYPNLSRWGAAAWDIFRNPKPVFFWMQSELTDKPMVHIPDARAQKDGSITVFSNCEEVELLVDGKPVARSGRQKDPQTAHLKAPAFVFQTKWTSGVLTARGLNQGSVVAEHSGRKAGKADHLELRIDPDCQPLYADGSSIVIAYARICDEAGTTVIDHNPPVLFRLTGPGSIIGGVEIGSNPVTWERGIAPALIQVGSEPGMLKLTAEAEGLKTSHTTIKTVPWTSDLVALKARPIRDPIRLRVDLGNLQQHLQDQFTPWQQSEQGGGTATFRINDTTKISVNVDAPGALLNWTHTWGVPGDLSFMIEDGVEINAPGQLVLTFNDLPAGTYRLKTWHHRLAGEQEKAPKLRFRVSDAHEKNRIVLTDYQPTFGKKIQVSAAGGGNRGDGGSNRAAAGYAQISFQASGRDPVKMLIDTEAKTGSLGLNAFDLMAR